MLQAVITTIQKPTVSVLALVERLRAVGGRLIVIGDKKGPADFSGPAETNQDELSWPVDFFDLKSQLEMPFELARSLPTGHYARKNLGYLQAIARGAECIYETDDDNAPNAAWVLRKEEISGFRLVAGPGPRWVNVYRYFSPELIWPRGLPLDEIRKETPRVTVPGRPRRAPIQQGLVNGSADVDAIWRLVMDREFKFDQGPSVYLEPGNWCPFNTQSTWWWPEAYPLLYVPSYCSFRMCDIWKSFIAQRCLWAMGGGMAFHAPEVFQDRNQHNLMRDFLDEVPGYKENRRIAEILDKVSLKSQSDQVPENLYQCYEALCADAIFPAEELRLVELWLKDLTKRSQ